MPVLTEHSDIDAVLRDAAAGTEAETVQPPWPLQGRQTARLGVEKDG